MASLGIQQLGLAALSVLLGGCLGSLHLGTHVAGESHSAPACVPASGSFRVSTLGWDDQARHDLEGRMRRNAVVVRAEGCGRRVLDGRDAGAKYAFHAEPLRRERQSSGSEMGLGVSTGPGMSSSTGAVHDVAIAGAFDLERLPSTAELQGSCAGATRVVARYSTGAFRIEDGHSKFAGVSLPYGARADARNWQGSDRRAGRLEACEVRATGSDAPPVDCSALIDLAVLPLPASPPPVAQAPGPKAATAEACTQGDVAACNLQCRRGAAAACATLTSRCASGSLPACMAAGSSSLERWLYAGK